VAAASVWPFSDIDMEQAGDRGREVENGGQKFESIQSLLMPLTARLARAVARAHRSKVA
jgi:hypothetical protein